MRFSTSQFVCVALLDLSLAVILCLQTALGAGPTTRNSESPPTACASGLPAGCLCGYQLYQDVVQYVVNCTNTNLRNTSVLENMPENVQVLIFTGNHIEELPWNVFGSINNYTQLKVVDMSNNRIRDIRGKSYHHVQNVERLILNHNNLSISRNNDKEANHHHPRVFSNFVNLISLHLTDAFDDNHSPQLSEDLHDIFMQSKLLKLQKLHLEQNEISSFKDRRIFCELPNLMDLHMGDNYLTTINFDLDCLDNLRFLDLKRNKFTHIKDADLLLLDKIDRQHSQASSNLIVDFDLNPFTCDCRIVSLLVWLQHTNVTVRNYEHFYCRVNSTHRVPLMERNMSHCRSAIANANALFANINGKFNELCARNFAMLLDRNTQDNNGVEDERPLYDTESTRLHSRRLAGLIFLSVVLAIVLLALLLTVLYINRSKLRTYISPVIQNATKKVYYTTINDESCPEVHV